MILINYIAVKLDVLISELRACDPNDSSRKSSAIREALFDLQRAQVAVIYLARQEK